MKGKHDRPLYFIGYIRSTGINRIHVDLRSALCVIPCWLMQSLGIYHIDTQITISGFNSSSMCLLEKIMLKCQIGDFKTEVTCYVITAETSYNLLLGHHWIHRNGIAPSTFNQVMKYVDDWGKVQTLIIDQHQFKGIENYFTNSLLYQDQLESSPKLEGPDFSNEADIEPESDNECP